MPRPLKNAQKGAQTKTRTPRRHQDTVRHRSGCRVSMTEEGRIPILEERPPLVTEGNGPLVESSRGGGGGG